MTQGAVWIHVGLAKTGTTTFQRLVFSQHPQINYLGKNWIDDDHAKAALVGLARLPDRRVNLETARGVFQGLVASAYLVQESRVSVLSEEDFTTFRFIDPQTCARRLASIFPDAHVLFVVREPLDWLQSMYFFRLSLRFPETLGGFNAWLRNSLDRRWVGTDIGQIQMGELAGVYAEYFGAKQLHVMRYEDFASDGGSFVSTICEMIGVDPALGVQLYETGADAPYNKARITERQVRFFQKFGLVMEGRYREYLAEVAPLLEALRGPAKKRARALVPLSLDLDRSQLVDQLRRLSVVLDRECRSYFRAANRATAEIDADLERRVRQISEPGLNFIASKLNPDVRCYLS
ncbi:MAG TPA: sulfotransferase [Rhizomicrobium sp.]|jgi:hypothetical protein|nr:sulfotransferase [Rhizomicrobium sp.]